MKLLPDIGYPQSYESVPSGTYVCMNCSGNRDAEPTTIVLNKQSTLPECEHCGATYWLKV